MTRLRIQNGTEFGWLTVVRQVPDVRGYATNQMLQAWACQCRCGKSVTVAGTYLVRGIRKSCGCLSRLLINSGLLGVKHGMTKSREYILWAAMRQRVKSTSPYNRKWYLDRGVKVCQRWDSDFESFLTDLGYRPSPKHSLDRVNSHGHYSCGQCSECLANDWPMNVRWATANEQGINKRGTRYATINGETKPWGEWCKTIGIRVTTARRRIERDGWSIEKALTTPVRKLNAA